MKSWLPSLNALRAFEAFGRHLNYSAAAQELGVTPAAVKQLVLKLEDTLGVSLVRREGKSLMLTPAGSAGLDDLTAGMKHFSSSVHKMGGLSQEKRLIVTVEASFATAWLVPKLEDFRARNPEINVLVDSSQKIVDLRQGDVDVAIRYGVEPENGLITYRLFDDWVFPACSPELMKRAIKNRALRSLKDVPLIHWDMSHMTWALSTKKWFVWENWLTHLGIDTIDTSGGLRFSDYGLAIQAAISGQGLLLASWPILSDPFDAGLLVRPFEESITTDIGYDLVVTPDAQQKPEVRAFTDWMKEAAGNATPSIT